MPATVIVGGQFGSEGKGKVAQFWARKDPCKRCGPSRRLKIRTHHPKRHCRRAARAEAASRCGRSYLMFSAFCPPAPTSIPMSSCARSPRSGSRRSDW